MAENPSVEKLVYIASTREKLNDLTWPNPRSVNCGHFVLVADSGSFRAAELACRSPSALSLSIRELEAALGGPLFEPERVPRVGD